MSNSIQTDQSRFVALVRKFSQLTGKAVPFNEAGHGAYFLGDSGLKNLADMVDGIQSFQKLHPGFAQIINAPKTSSPINSMAHGLVIVHQIDSEEVPPGLDKAAEDKWREGQKNDRQAEMDSYMNLGGSITLKQGQTTFVDNNDRKVSIDYWVVFMHGHMTMHVRSNLLVDNLPTQRKEYSDGELTQFKSIPDLEKQVFTEFKFVPAGKPEEVVEPLMAAARSSQEHGVLAVAAGPDGHTPATAKLDALLHSMGAFTSGNNGLDQTLSRFTPAPMALVALAASQ
ncbi:hypothetical protein [Pandoraea sp. PE-S2T-3]|uniref:hypothetical protein n=1 Tax=Pandoraea sp. PE-S2T-3 TaxID=1986993 RepID=UPI000B3F7F4C|nr:hypothetical protein [Pandoraea sp. PE-S2T-3]